MLYVRIGTENVLHLCDTSETGTKNVLQRCSTSKKGTNNILHHCITLKTKDINPLQDTFSGLECPAFNRTQ